MTTSMRPARLVRLSAVLVALALLLAPARSARAQAAAKPPAKPAVSKPAAGKAAKPATAPAAKPIDVALVARSLEEQGNYAGALAQLKRLRGMQGPDADLELAIALDEARTGLTDSAWTRLYGPVLSAALEDTMGIARRSEYPLQLEGAWVNGKFP